MPTCCPATIKRRAILCIFHAPVAEILAWSDIRRLEDEPGAPQRRMSPAKVKAIRRFLEQDKRNTIPTSVILTLDLPEGSVERIEGYESFAILTVEVLEGQQKPGLIIDGQHRLLGMNDFSPTTNVNVVAILGANDVEKAFQFLVINNKASKVSLDHIRALALHYEDEAPQNEVDYRTPYIECQCPLRWPSQRR